MFPLMFPRIVLAQNTPNEGTSDLFHPHVSYSHIAARVCVGGLLGVCLRQTRILHVLHFHPDFPQFVREIAEYAGLGGGTKHYSGMYKPVPSRIPFALSQHRPSGPIPNPYPSIMDAYDLVGPRRHEWKVNRSSSAAAAPPCKSRLFLCEAVTTTHLGGLGPPLGPRVWSC